MDAVDLGPARAVLQDMAPVDHGHAIPLLQSIQSTYGYLPREVLIELSAETGIPVSHLFGLATFYAQFHLEEHGRHTVRVCRGTACHVRGRQIIQEAIDEELGIGPGETTEDRRFSLETVACVGTCFLAPVVMVDHDYFGKVDPKKVGEIMGGYE
ncbi:MAG: NAD(P)H-dependent oxidoreductase subunit E [Acidimicrobiia bacterium]|nr:NAD(P)H-dependent oxidoreductase subunit E [Acidimicrobiia bacterium]